MTDRRSTPDEELPCIWAEAGVLSYRLCDRHYECEGCPLFEALSGGTGTTAASPQAPEGLTPAPLGEGPWAAPVAAYMARLMAGCTLRLDRTYSADHWWMDDSDGSGLTLGLEESAIRVLAPIDDIVVPRPGARARRSEPCAWILRGRTAVPLPPPVGGTVEDVNRRYTDTIRVWGKLPGGDEWLLRLAPDEPLAAVPDLYRGEAALTWHLGNLQLLRQVLREAVEERATREVGPTLNDGGEPDLDLERVLGHVRFEALLARMFPTPAS
jgi:glycine cleavage system H lipoate-binding protein